MPTVPTMTDLTVRKLRGPPGERIEYFDAAYPGLALRVSGPSGRSQGRKAWIYYVRIHGKQRKLTLGTYPAMTLTDARTEATKTQQQKKAGIDPQAMRQLTKAAEDEAVKPPTTFANVAALWIKRKLEAAKKNRTPRYISGVKMNLANHVYPRFGDRDIATITRQHVTAMLDIIYDGGKACLTSGKAHGGGGPIAANRTLASVRSIFSFAVERGLIERNPAAISGPGEEQKRDRVLSDDELAAELQAAACMPSPFGEFYQFLTYVPCRRDEARTLQWADLVDNEGGTMTWQQATNKSKRQHSLVLPATVTAMLKAMPRKKLSPFVFTVEGERPFTGLNITKRRLDAKIAEVHGGVPIAAWTIHDLRRTGATLMASLKVPMDIVSRTLNHSPKGITASVYVHHDFASEMADALQKLSDHLDGLRSPASSQMIKLATKKRA